MANKLVRVWVCNALKVELEHPKYEKLLKRQRVAVSLPQQPDGMDSGEFNHIKRDWVGIYLYVRMGDKQYELR